MLALLRGPASTTFIRYKSRGTFPVLSRDPSRKPPVSQGKRLVFEKQPKPSLAVAQKIEKEAWIILGVGPSRIGPQSDQLKVL